MKQKGKETQENLYEDVRNLTNPSTAMTLVCKDNDSNILSGKRQI